MNTSIQTHDAQKYKFRYTGIQKFRNSEIQKFRSSEIQKCRNSEIQKPECKCLRQEKRRQEKRR